MSDECTAIPFIAGSGQSESESESELESECAPVSLHISSIPLSYIYIYICIPSDPDTLLCGHTPLSMMDLIVIVIGGALDGK